MSFKMFVCSPLVFSKTGKNILSIKPFTFAVPVLWCSILLVTSVASSSSVEKWLLLHAINDDCFPNLAGSVNNFAAPVKRLTDE